MKCSYSIVYNHTGKLNKDGKSLVQIRVYQNLGYKQQQKYISTGIKIEPSQWDSKKSQIKNHANAVNLNAKIRKQLADLENFELKIINSNKDFNINMFNDFLKGKYTNSLIDFIENEVKEMQASKQYKPASIETYKASFKNLKQFRAEILMNELDYSLISDFDRFIRNKGRKQNTIARIHKHIKFFINKAVQRGYLEMHKNPYNNFASKTIQSTKIPLSTDELKKIEEIQFSNDYKHLNRIRDYFLFMVYTGLRYSDFVNLTKDEVNIKNIDDMFLSFNPIKTETTSNKRVYVPLKQKAVEIIKKYQNEDSENIFSHKDTFRLGNKITNQYFNRELKTLGVLCHIKKNITCHVARHTFATIILNAGVPIDVVSKLLGHTSISTTMIYAKTLPVKIKDSLKDIDFNF
ncbi:MAG: site-specific integrase [Bacteroidales bacterium]|nr:site-specific integrase [Bacteroidales bacterium]